MSEQTLILHHYDGSPFAEKVRLVLGLKDLAWRSVIIPNVLPKPLYTPLTGGYRRTPALQIDADVYCDTRLIVAVLDELFPEPGVFGDAGEGLCRMLETWADGPFFWPIARYVTGIDPDLMGMDFHRDRAAMQGRPVPDAARVHRAARRALPAIRENLRWLESALSARRDFLLGDEPTLADLAAYHGLWFLLSKPVDIGDMLTGRARIEGWRKRVERIGHGRPVPLDASDALAMARAAEPHAPGRSVDDSTLPPIGTTVTVTPTDYGQDPVLGTLSVVRPDRVSLLREDVPDLGRIALHFPRDGYSVRPAG